MIHVVSTDSPSWNVRDELYAELSEMLSPAEGCQSKQIGNVSVLHWRQQGVLLLDPEKPARFKDIQQLLTEKSSTNLQIWLQVPVSESNLRELRKMEAEGLLQLSCYLLDSLENTKVQDRRQLERIIKISQNRPLGAEWVSAESTVERSLFLSSVLNSRFGLNFPIDILPKVSSADTDPVETPLSRMMRAYYSTEKGRKIHWYPKKYVHKKMDEEKWGVDPLPKRKQGKVKRHVLVTGTGRSGTTYFSDLLTMLGLDVGHQRNGKDGCSGAEFAIDSDWYPWFPVYGGGDCANVGERRSDYTYAHVLHIVRHPLWCIPSLMKNYPAINPEFWADNDVMDPKAMNGSSIYRNASMYYGINKIIDESGQAEYRCQLEQIHDHWSTLMEILELSGTKDPRLEATNKATGWGQYEPLSWSQLELEVGATLANAIREQAKRYGYE